MITYREGIDKAAYSVIYYASCALHKKALQSAGDVFGDCDELYVQAMKHNMLSIVCTGMEVCGIKPRAAWIDARNKAIRKNMLLGAEKASLCSFFEHEGIWYMPLKGSVIKDMYPVPGMRQMADVDMLYDASFQKQVMHHMLDRGYMVKSVGKGNHDVYLKPPVYNFELHSSLFGAGHEEIYRNYYNDVKPRLIKDEGNSYGYHFSDEDFYIYMLVHMYKHYHASGTGLRSLMDVYVYTISMQGKLDTSYISRELKKLKLSEYEKKSRRLAAVLFSSKAQEIDDSLYTQLSYYISSGTYGNMKIRIDNKLKEYKGKDGRVTGISRLKYILSRSIPNAEFYKANYPFIYKHKILIPFFVVFRLLKALILNRKKVMQELGLALGSN